MPGERNGDSSPASCFSLIKQQIAERESAAAVEVQNTFVTLSSGDATTFVKSLSMPEDVLNGTTAQLIPPKELIEDGNSVGVVTTASISKGEGSLNDVHAAIAALDALHQRQNSLNHKASWPPRAGTDLRHQPSLSSTVTRRLSSDVFEDALRSYPSDPTVQDLSTAAWLRSICLNSTLESSADIPRLSTQDVFDFDNGIWEGLSKAPPAPVANEEENYRTEQPQKNALSEDELTDEILSQIPKSPEGELLSYGSIKHESATCKPCVFFRHPRKGCHNGVRCLFCHFPHEPKKRVRVSRKRRAARQAAAAAAAAEDAEEEGVVPAYPENQKNSSADEPLLSQLVSMHQRQLLEKRLQALRPLFMETSL